ncbi:MAG: protein kinase [Planctomycetes bacterium]|nr:protein kinase [Planctomycetota bacterium]
MTLARDPQDQERLIGLVRQALDRIDRGAPVDPVELCREAPHLLRPLAEVLGLAAELPELQQGALREDPLAGLLLAGRYRLEGCLGRGAMGVVYRAADQDLRRTVAVKILDARLFHDPQAEQRFQREGEALAALQHANVVAVHDRGRTPEGIHFLVMELLDGRSLAALLDGADPAAACRTEGIVLAEAHWPRQAAAWARDLATGLAAAHARGLVHRDVKPSNVFVARSGRPVLLDFGIAARSTDQRLTATQTTLGTPWYMAPEQVRAGGVQRAEPTLDVYGLGATLYHVLAGRPPYQGDAAAVLASLPVRDPDPLGAVAPELPRDLRAIVERCLERDAARRYPTAAALAADLDAFLRHQPVQARPLGAVARRLRRWRRAPARPVAVFAFAVALATAAVALPILQHQRRLQWLADKADLYASLPSVLAIEGWPDERVLVELHGEHRAAIALLDRILELDAADLPVRLWRACLRLDLADPAGAAADLQVLAQNRDSAYLRALAGRYLQLAPDQPGAMAVDTDGLPPPESAEDAYVAGFHELRARHRSGFAARADALLERAARGYLPARDLRLLAIAELAGRKPELRQLLYDETVALEQIYGRPTARTQAMRGLALLQQKRYADCIEPFEQSLRLRPERHGPHQNLGVALLRLGRFDECGRHLQQALRLRPFAWNTRQALAQLCAARGQFAEAYEWAAGLAKTGHRGEASEQPKLVGMIALAEATSLWRSDPAMAREAAGRAVAAYDESLAVRDADDVRSKRAIAAALAGERLADGIVPLAAALLAEPDDARQLANLAFLLPAEGLGPEPTAWLAALLRRLAIARAGGDAALQARLEAEIEQGLAPWRSR